MRGFYEALGYEVGLQCPPLTRDPRSAIGAGSRLNPDIAEGIMSNQPVAAERLMPIPISRLADCG